MRTRCRISGILAGFLGLVLLLPAIASGAASPFEPNHRVNDEAGTAEQRRVAVVADASGYVFAAWQDHRLGDFDIYVARSTDGGRTFGASIRLGDSRATGTTQERPAIALGPKGELVVAWQDDQRAYLEFDIFAAISYDRGTTFSSPVRVSDGPDGALQFAPTVAVDALGGVYVAWQDFRSGNGDIRLSRASVSAFQFGPSVRVDDNLGGQGTQSAPSLAVSPVGTVFIAYHDNRTGDANVYVARSTDGGATFGASVRANDGTGLNAAQGLPSLVADGLGNLFLVWQDERAGDFDIYFAKSTDQGRTFTSSVRADDGPRGSPQTAPRIALGAAGTLFVTWEDGRNVDSDVYFTWSTNGGSSFAASVRVDDAGDSTTDPAYQYGPQVAESRTGLVAVLWHDGRRDNGDIYASTVQLGLGSALRVEVGVQPRAFGYGEPTDITVRVTSNGTGVDGATVTLAANQSGAFSSIVYVGSGVYTASYAPASPGPNPMGTLSVAITARASKTGFVSGVSQAALQVMPRIAASLLTQWDMLVSGQTMEATVVATVYGAPLAGATVGAGTSAGGSLTSTWGITDAAGTWRTVFKALNSAAGKAVTITASVTKDGLLAAGASRSVAVLSDALPLVMELSSGTREFMSYETALIRVRLTGPTGGVPRAILTPYSLKGGNFSTPTDHGDGNYTFTFAAPLLHSQAWISVSVNAKVGGYTEVRGRIQFLADPNKTNPANPTQSYLSGDPPNPAVRAGQSIRFYIYVHTIEGFAVTGATIVVHTQSPYGVLSAVRDELNGVYTFDFTALYPSVDTGLLIRVQASKYGYNPSTTRIGVIITITS